MSRTQTYPDRVPARITLVGFWPRKSTESTSPCHGAAAVFAAPLRPRWRGGGGGVSQVSLSFCSCKMPALVPAMQVSRESGGAGCSALMAVAEPPLRIDSLVCSPSPSVCAIYSVVLQIESGDTQAAQAGL